MLILYIEINPKNGGDYMNYMKKSERSIMIISILFIVLGIILIAKPEFSLIAICRLFGIIILVPGIIQLANFLRKPTEENIFGLDLVFGLFFILLGIFMLIAPKAVVSAFPLMIVIVIIIDSILRLQLSINLKRISYDRWWVHLCFAILTGVLGVLLVFNPFAGSVILTRIIGITLTISGIVNLIGIAHISKAFK